MRRYRVEELTDYCYQVMVAKGVDPVCAKATAEMLADAEVTGMSTHGVSRLTIYMDRIKAGIMSPDNNIKIVQESPSALTIDAGNSLGAAAAKFAMEKCIEKARETGVCFAAVRNSNHFGTAAFYTKMAAEAGMMGLCCANLKGNVAPFGAAAPYLGTNPLSLSCPTMDRPLVTDIATSTVALGKLILAQKLGKPIPEGWALDQDGNPTTDPAEGRKGMLTPFGGPKGSGIAIMIDIASGILSGGGFGNHLTGLYEMTGPQGVGHFMGAIDVSHFTDLETFKQKVSQMSAEIKALKKAPGVEEILMPGDLEANKRAVNEANGIELPEPVYQELVNLGAPHGLTL